MVSSAETVVAGDVYIGWTGEDSAEVRIQAFESGNFIAGQRTNRITALGSALIEVISGGTVISSDTQIVVADVDGQWVTTAAVHLDPGTYSAVMTELYPVVSGGTVSGIQSLAQVFTVSSNSTSSSVTIANGESSGGITVSSGATLFVNGTVYATTIQSSGTESVTGGVDSGAIVLSGGKLVATAPSTPRSVRRSGSRDKGDRRLDDAAAARIISAGARLGDHDQQWRRT